MATAPTRIDGDLFAAAQASGALHSRSAAQQVNHWARIGRELEASANVSQRDIELVLAGDGRYDELAEREQAVVRGVWDERILERLASLDLRGELAADGGTWAESDADGRVTRSGHPPE